MKCVPSQTLPDVVVIHPQLHKDYRGHFLETFQAKRYRDHGLPATYLQDNLSYSKNGVLRGLHYQVGTPQGKLVWVVHGEVFDVAVDIRRGSPTFGKWVGMTLSSRDYCQAFIPPGFAHGFCVTSQTAVLVYKCTDYYAPREERGIRWNDPSLDIRWPIKDPILSEKDQAYSYVKEIDPHDFPEYKG